MILIVHWVFKHPVTIALAFYGLGILTIHAITLLSMISMLIGGGIMMWCAARHR